MLRLCHRLNNFEFLTKIDKPYPSAKYIFPIIKRIKKHIYPATIWHFCNFDLMLQEPEILQGREGKPQCQKHNYVFFYLEWKPRNSQENCPRFLPPKEFQTGFWFSLADASSTDCNSPDQVPTASSFFLPLGFPHTRHGPPSRAEQELFKQPVFSSGSMAF